MSACRRLFGVLAAALVVFWAGVAPAWAVAAPHPGIWATDPGVGGRQAFFVVGSANGQAVVEDAVVVCGSAPTTDLGSSVGFGSSELAPASRTDVRNALIRFRLDRRGHFGGWIVGFTYETPILRVPHGYDVVGKKYSNYPNLIGGDLAATSGRVQVSWPSFGGSGQCQGAKFASTEPVHLTSLVPHPTGVFAVPASSLPFVVGEIGVYAAGAVIHVYTLLQAAGFTTPSPTQPEPTVATCLIGGIADSIIENAQGGYTASNSQTSILTPVDRKTFTLAYASPTQLSVSISGTYVEAAVSGSAKTCIYTIPFTATQAPTSVPVPALDPASSGAAMPATARPPGTPPLPSSRCTLVHHRVTISISKKRYPKSALHIRRAIAEGWPVTLIVNRPGAEARRRRALAGHKTRKGFDRDEYPPAILRGNGPGLERGTKPTGWMASLLLIPSADNRGSGSVFGRKLRPYCNGQKIRLTGN